MKDKKSDRNRLADLVERIEADPKLHAAINGVNIPPSPESDPSISVRKTWIATQLQTVFNDFQKRNLTQDDFAALKDWSRNLSDMYDVVDEIGLQSMQTESNSLRSLFINALEVGFAFGTVADDPEQIKRALYAKAGRASGLERSQGEWKVAARRLANSISVKGTPLSAQGLAKAVLKAGDAEGISLPDPKTLALYMQALEVEPSSEIKLKVDGRAKKVRK